MIRLIRGLLGSRLSHWGWRGVSIIMLLSLISLAAPIVLGSTKVAGQLARNSQVYDRRLGGVFRKRWDGGRPVEILNDPNFDVGLTPQSPSRVITVQNNGENVTVTITKIFSGVQLVGQGLRISKTVNPTSSTPGTPTTYTYTIQIENIGAGAAQIDRVRNLLPGGFTYVSGSTSGITTSNPAINNQSLDQGNITFYLNDAASNPLPWSSQRGNNTVQNTTTPPRSTWTTLPQYWETDALVDGQFSSGQ